VLRKDRAKVGRKSALHSQNRRGEDLHLETAELESKNIKCDMVVVLR